jgi:hypothetical protein
VRCFGIGSEAASAVCFVILIITLKPHYLTLSLKREDMSSDTVEEPTIVADNNRASTELDECLFKSSKSIYIEVVGGLV